MKEGWSKDEYLIVFDETEAAAMTKGYGIVEFLPAHTVVAIIGWDDFVVRDDDGGLYRVPTVPLLQEHLQKLERIPDASSLVPDERFTGKIKWYVKPIVFGGDPSSEENITWVDVQTHQEVVCWWNQKYREIAGGS